MNLRISTPNTNPTSKGYLYRDGLEVVGLEITERGVTVTFRVRSSGMYLCHPPRRMPDMVWREEYMVDKDPSFSDRSILKLTRMVEAKHIPAEQIAEKVVWPDDERKDAVQQPPCGLGGIGAGSVSAGHWDGTTTAS